jgi:hypothetical protein
MNTLAGTKSSNANRELLQSTAAWQGLVPWLVFGVALITRLAGVMNNGLRTDEMYSVWMAARPLPEMLSAIVLEGHDATPPTYYVLLHLALRASWELWSIRLVSIVSGALIVVLTFQYARRMFDMPTALLSGLLLAVAPYSIDVSQVARAYTLSGLFALASLFYFARLGAPAVRPGTIWLYGAATLAAMATHYLAALVIIFQNLVVVALLVFRTLPRRKFAAWIKLQTLLGVLALPLLWMALQRLPGSGSGTGQDWLPAPSATLIIKALILWATGDPSHGGIGFTLARLGSLGVIAGLLCLGAFAAWRLWKNRPEYRPEVRRIAYVAGAFFGIWGMALAISLQRKIFHEKYFIYLAPLLIVILVWSGLRIRPVLLGRSLLVALFALTGLALSIHYTAPSGEQWREALAYVGEHRQPGDLIVTTPGYYARPASYYLTGNLPPVDYRLLRAPYAIFNSEGLQAAGQQMASGDLPAVAEVVATAERVWLVTGYASDDASTLEWFADGFTVLDAQEFLGVWVVLAERRMPASQSPLFMVLSVREVLSAAARVQPGTGAGE